MPHHRFANLPPDLEIASRPRPRVGRAKPVACDLCGEFYDSSDLEQVYRHSAPEHARAEDCERVRQDKASQSASHD